MQRSNSGCVGEEPGVRPHPFCPVVFSPEPSTSLALYPMLDLVLTLEQRVQQVLTDSFGPRMIDQETCTKQRGLAQP